MAEAIRNPPGAGGAGGGAANVGAQGGAKGVTHRPPEAVRRPRFAAPGGLPSPSQLVIEALNHAKKSGSAEELPHGPLIRALDALARPSAQSPAWGAASQKRAIVVGAGMAGLAAANELRYRGFDVVVLEARDRVGGRVCTDATVGIPVDLGACECPVAIACAASS